MRNNSTPTQQTNTEAARSSTSSSSSSSSRSISTPRTFEACGCCYCRWTFLFFLVDTIANASAVPGQCAKHILNVCTGRGVDFSGFTQIARNHSAQDRNLKNQKPDVIANILSGSVWTGTGFSKSHGITGVSRSPRNSTVRLQQVKTRGEPCKIQVLIRGVSRNTTFG